MKPETLEMKNYRHGRLSDPILIKYQPSELRIAAEFLTNFLPFLTKDLCNGCTQTLAEQIRSLDSEVNFDAESSIPSEDYAVLSVNHQDMHMDGENNCDNWKCEVNPGSGWNDGPSGWSSDEVVDVSGSGTEDKVVNVDPPSVRMSWADMAQEDELEEDEEGEGEDGSKESVAAEDLNLQKSGEKGQRLSREQREYLRFMNVQRKKDFICFERIKARLVNVVEGLELHSGVFSVVEQKKIVDFIYRLQEMGGKGELKARTYSSPKKWMKGKGRITIQFGCCYNYATDKNGNPPGILRSECVDPIPHLFKVIIKRLVGWHVLPPSCIPDSCIVNIYDEGDCIPPHIDNNDFVRPFCTVSFLSECNIVFGSNLEILGPGEFSGPVTIPLSIGSVLVLNGNGADVAKHCVPAVPTKRISITFRKMNESKLPLGFIPESDLQGIEPLPYGESRSLSPLTTLSHTIRQSILGASPSENKNGRGHYSEPVPRVCQIEDENSRNRTDNLSKSVSRDGTSHIIRERGNCSESVSSQGPSEITTGRGTYIAPVSRASPSENRNRAESYSEPAPRVGTSRIRRDGGNNSELVSSEGLSENSGGRGTFTSLVLRTSPSENRESRTDGYSKTFSRDSASRNRRERGNYSEPVSSEGSSGSTNERGTYTTTVSRESTLENRGNRKVIDGYPAPVLRDGTSLVRRERDNYSESVSCEVPSENKNGRGTYSEGLSGETLLHSRNGTGGNSEPVLRNSTSRVRKEGSNYFEPVLSDGQPQNRSGRGAYTPPVSRSSLPENRNWTRGYSESVLRDGASRIRNERGSPVSSEVLSPNRSGRDGYTILVSTSFETPSGNRNRTRTVGYSEPSSRDCTSRLRGEIDNYSEPVSREGPSGNRSGRGAYTKPVSREGLSDNRNSRGSYSEQDWNGSPSENRRGFHERGYNHLDPNQFSQNFLQHFDLRRLGPLKEQK